MLSGIGTAGVEDGVGCKYIELSEGSKISEADSNVPIV